MIQAKQDLLAALGAAIAEVSPGAGVAAAFESPKQAAHGDLACTAALQLARPLKKNPREVATALIDALNRQPAVQRWVASMDIAGPGFVNIRLRDSARQAVVAEVMRGGDSFGRAPANGRPVIVEFVSANPTGPLHAGHTDARPAWATRSATCSTGRAGTSRASSITTTRACRSPRWRHPCRHA